MIATATEIRTFQPRETLFAQGDSGDHAFVIRSGEVEVFRMSNGIPMTLGVVRPGELLGEVALLDGGTRLAHAVALTEVEAVRIHRDVFERYLQDMDGMAGIIVNSLIDYVRTSIGMVDDMMRIDDIMAGDVDGSSTA
jgi:CRP/FNR family transcriptional regulator